MAINVGFGMRCDFDPMTDVEAYRARSTAQFDARDFKGQSESGNDLYSSAKTRM
jgi:hypothetical protein